MEINEKLEQIGNTWEHYKAVNDERLQQLERKGNADAMTLEQLEKINTALDNQKCKIEKIEVSMSRPNFESKSSTNENIEYKKALTDYLKKGLDSPLANLERKMDYNTAINDGGAYGGYLVSQNMNKIIANEISESCFMRKICSVQNIGSSALEVIDDSDFATSWIDETGAVDDSDVSILTKLTIRAHELVAQPKVTQKLLDDSFINIEEFIADRLASQFSAKEEEAFLNGLGDTYNQPNGILGQVGEGTTVISSQIASFKEQDIIDLYYLLGQKYVGKASFVMSRESVSKVRMLKDSTSGAYLWQPALLGGNEDTILGCPVYQSQYMPLPEAGASAILFGNFKYYQIVDRNDIRILRDLYTAKPYVRFYTTKRVGGDVVRKDAFAVLKCKSAE
jgi:HK97 family phage major capsid protein